MAVEFLTIETTKATPQAKLHIVNNGPAIISIWPELGRTPIEQIRYIDESIRIWADTSDDIPMRILSVSPYVLRTVEVCATKYAVADKITYRRMRDDGSIETVSRAEELYRPWAEAFREIDELTLK